MTVFDLLFLALALVALATVVAALARLLRGNRPGAQRLVRRLALGTLGYFGVVAAVSLASPRRVVASGMPTCSDDWCIAVLGSRRIADRVEVTFLLSSRARGISQRERFVTAWLVDADGHRIAPVPGPVDVPFDTLLHAGERLEAHRQYAVPAGTRLAGVSIVREGAGRFPGCCIIGDPGSLLHPPPLARLE